MTLLEFKNEHLSFLIVCGCSFYLSLLFVGCFFSPYFRPRSNALEGMFVASFVGVCSGYYIFKPLLDEIAANQAERKRREALEAAAVAVTSGGTDGSGSHFVDGNDRPAKS
jgi:hypothetical protein